MSQHFDSIVIGAGYAGAAAAALLANNAKDTLLIEAHYALGGCASFFRRKHFFFNSGATTLSGVLPNQPLGQLQKQLGISFQLSHLPIGMIIKSKQGDIIRYADKNQWIQECNTHFPHPQQADFWNELYRLEKKVWDIVANNPFFPPATATDIFRLAKPSNLKGITLLKGIISPLDALLKHYRLHDNPQFRRFIDEQLIISTQSYADTAPYITSAMGLTYPSQTYYPYGGIVQPVKAIINSFTDNGGTLRTNEAVTAIHKQKNTWLIHTSKGKTFTAKNLISSIPVWNMPSITHDEVRQYYHKKAKRFDFSWGAFMVYFAIETKESLPTAYYQIHTEEIIPHCQSRSFFATISLSDDTIKAPAGWKTVTISTHTLTRHWMEMNDHDYHHAKHQTLEYIMKHFDKHFPQLHHCKKEWINAATPRTFSHYTHRLNGNVGGIPHSIKQNFLTLPHNVTPFKGLYHIGDSAFPGQGTPSVVLGASNVVQRILQE